MQNNPSPMSNLETPRALLDRLRAAGLEFRVEAGRLRVKQGWRKLPAEDRRAVNQHRATLIALIAEQPAAVEPVLPPAPAAVSPTDYRSLGALDPI